MKVQKACHVFKVLVTIAMVVCFIAVAATISAFVSMYAFDSNIIFQMVAEERRMCQEKRRLRAFSRCSLKLWQMRFFSS